MNAFKLDQHGVSEVERNESEIVSAAISWGALALSDTHDNWHDEERLFAPGCAVATIGPQIRMPLSVFIVGHEGERSISMTMSVAELAGLVQDIQAIG